jgi:hypothetical protein
MRLNNWSIAASYDTARIVAGLGFGYSTASRSIISRAKRCLARALSEGTSGDYDLPEWFLKRFPAEYHRKRLFEETPKSLLHVALFEKRANAPLVSVPERDAAKISQYPVTAIWKFTGG